METRVTPQATRIKVLVSCFILAFGRPVAAQDEVPPRPYSNLTLAAANSSLGALVAIAGQAIRRERLDAKRVAYGAGGGFVVFGGKALVAENLWYTNLLGRQMAAVAASGIQNVASGRSFLDRFSLPYGPARFNVDPGSPRPVRLKVDIARTLALVAAVSDVHMEMDVGRSLVSGVAVFRDSAPRDELASGSHIGGVVTFRERNLAGISSEHEIRRTMAHELIHVVQSDFLFNTWGGPLERAFLQDNALLKKLNVYFDLGVDVPVASLVNSFTPYKSRPWEREAASLPSRAR
jgi:hypothetical protein